MTADPGRASWIPRQMQLRLGLCRDGPSQCFKPFPHSLRHRLFNPRPHDYSDRSDSDQRRDVAEADRKHALEPKPLRELHDRLRYEKVSKVDRITRVSELEEQLGPDADGGTIERQRAEHDKK